MDTDIQHIKALRQNLKAKKNRVARLMKVIFMSCWIAGGFLPQTAFADTQSDPTDQGSSIDVLHYDLEVKIDMDLRRIGGRNTIRFRALESFDQVPIHLKQNLRVARVMFEDRKVPFAQGEGIVLIELPRKLEKGEEANLTILYGGPPQEALSPPWSGGFVWKRDPHNEHLVGVACKGDGAHIWWPMNNDFTDRPDSMTISVIIPDYLVAVANGNLRAREKLAGNFMKWQWAVTYPIHPYNVSFYIGDYVHFTKKYEHGDSKFDLDFYVLRDQEAKAKLHFQQVEEVIVCFEEYFGPYPFPRDGFALIEAPYSGMEHQGAIAYGGDFTNSELGFDLGLAHETLQEWFGNSISAGDPSDFWIQEAMAAYGESLLLECQKGYEVAAQHLGAQRDLIVNRVPITGQESPVLTGSDSKNKGAWMLHSLRNVVNDDDKWFRTLKAFSVLNRMKTLSTEGFVAFFNQHLGTDHTPFFSQYLRHAELPVLEYKVAKKGKKAIISYRWNTTVDSFRMPIKITVNGVPKRLQPTAKWQTLEESKISLNDIEFPDNLFLYRLSLLKK